MTRYLLAAAWLAVAAPAMAQDAGLIAESGSRPVIRADATYFFNYVPDSKLVFEAQIAPRIIILDSIGKATTKVLAKSKARVWGWQVSATPMVRLRMFHERSAPVRTPSYMPKGGLQVVRFKNLSRATDVDDSAFTAGPIEMWLLDVIPFGHHSNGQTGCLFAAQTTPNCAEPPGGAINTADGSFSTNYIEATLHYGRMHLSAIPGGDFATRWEWRLGGGIQLNPQGFGGGPGLSAELAPIYGGTRTILEGMAARRDVGPCGRMEISAGNQFIAGLPSGPSHNAFRLEGVCSPKKWGGTGLFVRLFHGQDYYNLSFFQTITRLQIGFTLQRSPFLGFRFH